MNAQLEAIGIQLALALTTLNNMIAIFESLIRTGINIILNNPGLSILVIGSLAATFYILHLMCLDNCPMYKYRKSWVWFEKHV